VRGIAGWLFFVALVLSIWFGLHWFVWTQLARAPRLPEDAQLLIGAWLALASLSTLVSLFRIAPRRLAGLLWHVAFAWAGFVFLLATTLAVGQLGRAVARAIAPSLLEPSLTRRVSAAAVVTALGLAVFAWRRAIGAVPVKRLEVRLDQWPEALDGFSIVLLSDLHVSPGTKVQHIQRIVEQVNAERPDLVAVVGDLADGTPELLHDRIAPLAALESRHGVFFTTGNHEYYSGADQWLAKVRSLGMRTLYNERISIGRDGASFDLVGIPDLQGSQFGSHHVPQLAEVMKGHGTSRAVVLLAHQPRQFAEAVRLGIGLQLSGHTHGGQLWPFTWLVRLAEPRFAGLYREGRSQLYVSRGTGFWGPPMRLGAPQEIAHLTLRAAG